MATYLSGGEHIEDCNLFRTERYLRNPDYRFASADTLLRIFQTLSIANRTVSAESGKTYQFNVNDKLNSLLLDSLLLCGLMKENAPVVFDYDNQFVAAEKYDAKYSYKKAFGYFPGIAQVNLRPFYIENQDIPDLMLYQLRALSMADSTMTEAEIENSSPFWVGGY